MPTNSPSEGRRVENHPQAAAPSALLYALQGLTRVTVPRGGATPDAIKAGAERLARMLLKFPGWVALQAIDEWPSQEDGKFFPTENELQALAAVIKRTDDAKRSRAEAAKSTQEGRYMSPFGATAQYVEKVERVFGEPYVKSWLVGGINAQFTEGMVFLTGSGFDKLTADTWHMANEAGVKLRACKQVSKLLADHCDKLERDGAVKPKKRKGGWE